MHIGAYFFLDWKSIHICSQSNRAVSLARSQNTKHTYAFENLKPKVFIKLDMRLWFAALENQALVLMKFVVSLRFCSDHMPFHLLIMSLQCKTLGCVKARNAIGNTL